jgi:ribosomal protein S18 acetylase RimI-like enzyme
VKATPRIYSREAHPADSKAVSLIEHASFDNPLIYDDIHKTLTRTLRESAEPRLFARIAEVVAGHLEPTRRRPAGHEATHAAGWVLFSVAGRRVRLLRLAVDPKWRLHGVGRTLLGDVLAMADGDAVDDVVGEVALANLGALKWLRSCGMRATGSEPRGGEDVVLFRWRQEMACEGA